MIRNASSRKVTTIKNLPMAGRYLLGSSTSSQPSYSLLCRGTKTTQSCAYTALTPPPFSHPQQQRPFLEENSRLHRVRKRIQKILDFTRLFTDCVQWTGIAGCVGPARTVETVLNAAEVVAGCATYLGHGRRGSCTVGEMHRGKGMMESEKDEESISAAVSCSGDWSMGDVKCRLQGRLKKEKEKEKDTISTKARLPHQV